MALREHVNTAQSGVRKKSSPPNAGAVAKDMLYQMSVGRKERTVNRRKRMRKNIQNIHTLENVKTGDNFSRETKMATASPSSDNLICPFDWMFSPIWDSVYSFLNSRTIDQILCRLYFPFSLSFSSLNLLVFHFFDYLSIPLHHFE